MTYQRQLPAISSRLYTLSTEAETVHVRLFLCLPAGFPAFRSLLFYCSFKFTADLSRLRSRFPTGHDQTSIDADYNLDAGLRSYVNFKDSHHQPQYEFVYSLYIPFRYFLLSHMPALGFRGCRWISWISIISRTDCVTWFLLSLWPFVVIYACSCIVVAEFRTVVL